MNGKTIKKDPTPRSVRNNPFIGKDTTVPFDKATTSFLVESLKPERRTSRSSAAGRPAVRDLDNCFAVKLARFLAEAIASADNGVVRGKTIGDHFYENCLDAVQATELSRETDDADIMTIYMKQCMHIMRASGVIQHAGRRLSVLKEVIDRDGLFTTLFASFWNETPWDAIFPSMPDLALDLHRSRNILRDLVAKNETSFRLDAVSNEFFDLTGFTDINDMITISFLDFYFFTWLRLFGLIEYTRQKAYSPVVLRLTDSGRYILRTMI